MAHAQSNANQNANCLIQAQPGVNLSVLSKQYNLFLRDSIVDKDLYSVVVQGGNVGQTLERMAHDPRLRHVEVDAVLGTPENQVLLEGDPVHVPFDFSASFSAFGVADDTGDLVNLNPFAQVNLGSAQAKVQGQGVTVAILDTGVNANHAALQGHLVSGFNALAPDTAPDDIQDGISNQVYGHGTMVAGIISALAPQARIMPIRVLNGDGCGDLMTVVRGIRYAVAHGARILNMSFGTSGHSAVLDDAILEAQQAGCILIAAAGNKNSFVPYYPAACSGVLSVVAVDVINRKASFSNFGVYASLCAPGVGIRSTFADGGYASWSGTSFAAPFVSGAAALVVSGQSAYDPARATRRLWATARNLNATNPGFAGLLGKGMIDITRSLEP